MTDVPTRLDDPRGGSWVVTCLGVLGVVALVAVLIVAVVISRFAGLYARDPVPAAPTSTRVPTIVGIVAKVKADPQGLHVTLQGGQTVLIPYPDQPTSAWLTGRSAGDGDLLLGGHDGEGEFWVSAPYWKSGCYQLRGGAFEENRAVHFSDGLILPEAATFRVDDPGGTDSWPARPGDTICVDLTGQATELDVFRPD